MAFPPCASRVSQGPRSAAQKLLCMAPVHSGGSRAWRRTGRYPGRSMFVDSVASKWKAVTAGTVVSPSGARSSSPRAARRRRRRAGRQRDLAWRPEPEHAARLPAIAPTGRPSAASTAWARTSRRRTGRPRSPVPPGTMVTRDRALSSPTSMSHGEEIVVAKGGRGRPRQRALRHPHAPGAAGVPSPGTEGEERASAGAEADRRRRPRRHARTPASRTLLSRDQPGARRRSPTIRSPRSSRNLGIVRLDEEPDVRDRRHSRAHRGRAPREGPRASSSCATSSGRSSCSSSSM